MEQSETQLEGFLEQSPPSALVWGGVGLIAGFVVYVLGFVATVGLVPHVKENARSVVDLPWETYAPMPTMIAVAVAIPLGFICSVKRRMAFWFAATVSILFCSCAGLSLLRRDFIGKF